MLKDFQQFVQWLGEQQSESEDSEKITAALQAISSFNSRCRNLPSQYSSTYNSIKESHYDENMQYVDDTTVEMAAPADAIVENFKASCASFKDFLNDLSIGIASSAELNPGSYPILVDNDWLTITGQEDGATIDASEWKLTIKSFGFVRRTSGSNGGTSALLLTGIGPLLVILTWHTSNYYNKAEFYLFPYATINYGASSRVGTVRWSINLGASYTDFDAVKSYLETITDLASSSRDVVGADGGITVNNAIRGTNLSISLGNKDPFFINLVINSDATNISIKPNSLVDGNYDPDKYDQTIKQQDEADILKGLAYNPDDAESHLPS